jgi:hypothetical protein
MIHPFISRRMSREHLIKAIELGSGAKFTCTTDPTIDLQVSVQNYLDDGHVTLADLENIAGIE